MHSLVQDLMTQVVTVEPTTPFKEVVARLVGHRVSAVSVVDDDRRVLSLVSEADLLLKEEYPDPEHDVPLVWTKRRWAERKKAAAAVARDLMAVAVVSISPDATVAQAARRMRTTGVKRPPVVDQGAGWSASSAAPTSYRQDPPGRGQQAGLGRLRPAGGVRPGHAHRAGGRERDPKVLPSWPGDGCATSSQRRGRHCAAASATTTPCCGSRWSTWNTWRARSPSSTARSAA